MVKVRNDSKIVIWSSGDINDPLIRRDEYKNADVLQVEPGRKENEYIVEIYVRDKK